MFQKGTKYYADWRDASGNRKRKAFDNATAALNHEAHQKQSRPQSGALLPQSSRPSSAAQTVETVRAVGRRPLVHLLPPGLTPPSNPSPSETFEPPKPSTPASRPPRAARPTSASAASSKPSKRAAARRTSTPRSS